MKIQQVRYGEKFVFADDVGVWEKMTDTKARRIFGTREGQGQEKDINPDDFVFVFFKDKFPAPAPMPYRKASVGDGIKLVVVDVDSDEVYVEIVDATASQIAVYTHAESLRLKPFHKKNVREFMVSETPFDVESNTVFVVVRDGMPVGGREEENDARQSGRDGDARVDNAVEGRSDRDGSARSGRAVREVSREGVGSQRNDDANVQGGGGVEVRRDLPPVQGDNIGTGSVVP